MMGDLAELASLVLNHLLEVRHTLIRVLESSILQGDDHVDEGAKRERC